MKNAEIAKRRLVGQGLSTVRFKDPAEVVSHLGAVQAQDYAGAKWALGQLLEEFTDSDLDSVFNNGSILRTHLLRPTWHFVTPKDIRWMLKLTAARVHAVNAYMYRKAEVDASLIKRTNAIIIKTLRDGNHCTRTEIASALEQDGISTKTEFRLSYIMMHAELDGIICSGPRKGKQFTYALLEEHVPPVKALKRDEALAELVRRYFKTRGPASLQDFCVWSGLTMADAKEGIAMVKSEFASVEVNEQTYWFDDSISLSKKTVSLACLLPNYDEYFIGFKDRSAIAEFSRAANLTADDPALLSNIIILNGQIVGGWKRTLTKNEVQIETSLITTLSQADKEHIQQAANRFGKFIELPIKLTHKDINNE